MNVNKSNEDNKFEYFYGLANHSICLIIIKFPESLFSVNFSFIKYMQFIEN